MGLPMLFPNWTMEKSRSVTQMYLIIQAIVLTIALSALLINSMFGKTLKFVTLISCAFIISNISIAVATLLFTQFQNTVLTENFALAMKQSVPFNIVMCVFVLTLCMPHWFFFYTYFECCTTMPYFYRHEKVPRWVRNSLRSLHGFMIVC